MKVILSADLNWGIGYKGELLKRIPEDMKFFRNMTVGKIVVMGRGTFESLPGKQPLKGRINIVLSKNESFSVPGVIVSRSLDDLLLELKKYPSDDICIIGGESVYDQLLPFCSEAYITRFEKAFKADRYFPDIEKMKNWSLISESEPGSYEGLSYRFLKYVNNDFVS